MISISQYTKRNCEIRPDIKEHIPGIIFMTWIHYLYIPILRSTNKWEVCLPHGPHCWAITDLLNIQSTSNRLKRSYMSENPVWVHFAQE